MEQFEANDGVSEAGVAVCEAEPAQQAASDTARRAVVAGHVVAGRRVRVAHLSLTLATGGLERLLTDFARRHDRQRYEVEFIAVREIGRFAEEIRQAGCPVLQLTGNGRWRRLNELRRHLRERRIDILHTHNTWPHLYGTLTARLAGVPVVVNTRHGQRLGHGWKSRLPYRLAAQFTDRIVAVSDDAARMCRTGDGVPAGRVARIWNGIDTVRFAPAALNGQTAGGLPGRDDDSSSAGMRLVSVARLSPEKDFSTLLRAVAQARPRLPGLRLTIAGDGPQMPVLQQLRRELELEDVVQLPGDCSDVPGLLAQSDLFVSSSLSEGISLTLLEAMATGLPVLTTDVGGNPEIVVDGETGCLVPAGDAAQLAEALVEVCSRRARWRDMGAAGRRRVEQHFDVQRMVGDYEELYEELLARHPRDV